MFGSLGCYFFIASLPHFIPTWPSQAWSADAKPGVCSMVPGLKGSSHTLFWASGETFMGKEKDFFLKVLGVYFQS